MESIEQISEVMASGGEIKSNIIKAMVSEAVKSGLMPKHTCQEQYLKTGKRQREC